MAPYIDLKRKILKVFNWREFIVLIYQNHKKSQIKNPKNIYPFLVLVMQGSAL
jgi:hypothetical protein